MSKRRLVRGLAALLFGLIVLLAAFLMFPGLVFAYQANEGRLTLYSDQPFDAGRGRAVLADVEARLESSPLDDRREHGIVITNTEWRRRIAFAIAAGAAGVNLYPLTNNVFIARADVGKDTVYGASGKPAAPPRTLAYYAAHEISHSFTAEFLGIRQRWNAHMPQWIREGYADYVGMNGHSDLDDLYRRYRAGDPDLNFQASHTYAQFRMLVAFMLERQHWTVEQLVMSGLAQDEAEGMLKAGMVAGAP